MIFLYRKLNLHGSGKSRLSRQSLCIGPSPGSLTNQILLVTSKSLNCVAGRILVPGVPPATQATESPDLCRQKFVLFMLDFTSKMFFIMHIDKHI